VGQTTRAGDSGRDWQTFLAYLTGAVEPARLLRNADRVTANRLLRPPLPGRVRWRASARQARADLGQTLGHNTLEAVATRGNPAPLLGWHRTRVAQQCAGAAPRRAPGRPLIAHELEALRVPLAQEKRSWGAELSSG
jgi:hypothetical protein